MNASTVSVSCVALVTAFCSWSFAAEDAPAPDTAQLLQALRQLKEQQLQQSKVQKQKVAQDLQGPASSPSAAAAAWEEAVRQVQFEGVSQENAQFREWKEKEGAALREAEVQNAARLYFQWLSVTLQRSSGVPVKDLLSAVIQHTKELTAHQNAIETIEDRVRREKEVAGGNKQRQRERADGATQIKMLGEQILKADLAGSPPAQALGVGEFVNVPNWENSPGNFNGIFEKIILPELRATKDARLLDYWDMKIKKEGEAAAKSKLQFQAERFAQVRRPELLWSKAQDTILLGQRNRAITDMFSIVRSYPAHPRAGAWIAQLEAALLPPGSTPAPAPASALRGPATSAASGGSAPVAPAGASTPGSTP